MTDRLKIAGGECPNQSGQEDFYEVVTAARVVEEMNNCISEVDSVINLPKTTTRVLLNYFRWDKEKIIEKFYDEDQEKLFAKARVVNPFVVGKPEAAPVVKLTSARCVFQPLSRQRRLLFLVVIYFAQIVGPSTSERK